MKWHLSFTTVLICCCWTVIALVGESCATSSSCTSSQGCGLRAYLSDLQQEYDKLACLSSKLNSSLTVLTAANSTALTIQIQTRSKQYQKILDAQKLLSMEMNIINVKCSNNDGDNCDLACFGISPRSASVCSSHGSCMNVDVCKCNDGWTGLNCSIPMCDNIATTNSSVCSGKGVCISNNTCQCNSGVAGSFCNVTSIGGDDTTGRMYGDGTMAKSCYEYRYPSTSGYYYSGNISSGYYWIKPDSTAYKVHCEMVAYGGGLTAMTNEVETTSLNTASRSRYYFYVKNSNVWYRSPTTTNVWRWLSFAGQVGDYIYTLNNGVTMNSFTCATSYEGAYGVGCSEGLGDAKKMVAFSHTTENYCDGCQNIPNAFETKCWPNTRIYIL